MIIKSHLVKEALQLLIIYNILRANSIQRNVILERGIQKMSNLRDNVYSNYGLFLTAFSNYDI